MKDHFSVPNIIDYGWRVAQAEEFAVFSARGLTPGRVIVQQRGLFTIVTDLGEVTAQLAGRLLHGAAPGEHPVVGDWVAVAVRAEQTATIHAVLPRRMAFTRQAAGGVGSQTIAANVDIACLVTSINRILIRGGWSAISPPPGPAARSRWWC